MLQEKQNNTYHQKFLSDDHDKQNLNFFFMTNTYRQDIDEVHRQIFQKEYKSDQQPLSSKINVLFLIKALFDISKCFFPDNDQDSEFRKIIEILKNNRFIKDNIQILDLKQDPILVDKQIKNIICTVFQEHIDKENLIKIAENIQDIFEHFRLIILRLHVNNKDEVKQKFRQILKESCGTEDNQIIVKLCEIQNDILSKELNTEIVKENIVKHFLSSTDLASLEIRKIEDIIDQTLIYYDHKNTENSLILKLWRQISSFLTPSIINNKQYDIHTLQDTFLKKLKNVDIMIVRKDPARDMISTRKIEELKDEVSKLQDNTSKLQVSLAKLVKTSADTIEKIQQRYDELTKYNNDLSTILEKIQAIVIQQKEQLQQKQNIIDEQEKQLRDDREFIQAQEKQVEEIKSKAAKILDQNKQQTKELQQTKEILDIHAKQFVDLQNIIDERERQSNRVANILQKRFEQVQKLTNIILQQDEIIKQLQQKSNQQPFDRPNIRQQNPSSNSLFTNEIKSSDNNKTR